MSAPPFQRKKCVHRKPSGASCRAWAQDDTGYCWVHNPDGRAQQRIAATKKMNAEGRVR